jgi:hypothetical protein
MSFPPKDGLARGDIVGPPSWVNPTVSGILNTFRIKNITVDSSGYYDIAMIFDSSYPTGGDWDLKSPGKGTNNKVPLGNLIIISEDGNSTDPDDQVGGGTVWVEFFEPTKVTGLKLIDYEKEKDLIITFLDEDDKTKGQLNSPQGIGDNGVWIPSGIEVDGVKKIQFVSTTSGAIASIDYCACPARPTPEPTPGPTLSPQGCSAGRNKFLAFQSFDTLDVGTVNATSILQDDCSTLLGFNLTGKSAKVKGVNTTSKGNKVYQIGNTGGNNNVAVLSFNEVDVSDARNVTVFLDYVISDPGDKWEEQDHIIIDVMDNQHNSYEILNVNGSQIEDQNLSGKNSASISIPDTVNSLRLRVRFESSFDDEKIFLDNIVVNATSFLTPAG